MSGTGENGSDAPGGELPEYADRVLDLAERIPPGRVMTYGDVAEYLNEEGHPDAHPEAGGGGRRMGPRQVGRVMALYGGAVPWWRVVRADGVLLPGSERRALQHYRTEGTPLREPKRTPGSREERGIPRLDMARARWDGSEPDTAGSRDAGGAPDREG
ncbi:MGMT family protein [Streptomyces sp. CA-132043]|uniref:MGMT family protein n=1 Tax=Streptomyces sp. CA-132043 TaxID=3240048 RepID=UPI003D8DBCC1